jgi:signal transduction histidine kinase
MQNLILNSVRAVKAKGNIEAIIDVTLKTYINTGYHIISIQDNGIGMTKDEVEKCREKYYTTYINSGGTGLGLYFSEKYIREFGGKMEISSKPGEGTIVTLFLPIIESDDETMICE